MVRLIKRYESRKLYDTEESRYVSLEEIAEFVRRGQEVRVLDNASEDDVTAQTLTQIMLEEGRNGRSPVPTELLHDLVRMGKKSLSTGVEQVQQGVDRLLEASFDRVAPIRQARDEMDRLRTRLEDLEGSLVRLEAGSSPVAKKSAPKKRATRKRAATKKSRKRKKTTSQGATGK
ncbi:MAG: polyhydroxyalkanoate synthesis regulator DNA-binding domain-containing protein [Acidobacteriota bacterium]|nr:polyhydroxyalkanoate synthesis regulator DNA-binding domain-containing protein [Acidobacteriota bacterium]